MKVLFRYGFLLSASAILALSSCGTSKKTGENTDAQPIEMSQDVDPSPPMLVQPGSVSIEEQAMTNSIYDYSFSTLQGETIQLHQFRGRKILIVNTASECGYTPQYKELQQIANQYKEKLVVIGFPTNDFGGQEPGSNEQIAKFCTENFQVSFPMAEKITVKGEEAHPIYKWLTRKQYNGKMDSDVRWNFQKYLIDENGELMQVFPSKTKPDDLEIIKLIEK